MANSRSNIYPVQLQGAELNLNKLDAEIKQYSGFNKNNAPFVGGCLSNIFTKDETIEGATSKNTYIAPNGDIYRVNTEGLWKNEEKLVDYTGKKFYDVVDCDFQFPDNTVFIDSEECYVTLEYVYGNSENMTVNWTLHVLNVFTEEWEEYTYNERADATDLGFSCDIKCCKNDNTMLVFMLRQFMGGKLFVFKITENGMTLIDPGITVPMVMYFNFINQVVQLEMTDDSHGILSILNNERSSSFVFFKNYDFDMEGNITLRGDINRVVGTGQTAKTISYFSETKAYVTELFTRNAQNYSFGLVYDYKIHNGEIILSNEKKCNYLARNGMVIEGVLRRCNNKFGFAFFTYWRSTDNSYHEFCGICDFITGIVSKRELNTGLICGDYVLYNNEVVSGICLPGGIVLASEWNSVEEKDIFLQAFKKNYEGVYSPSDCDVIYKTKGVWVKLKESDPQLNFINNQIITNVNYQHNAFDVEYNKKLLFAPAWNNRFPMNKTSYIYNREIDNYNYAASSINEYNLQDNASIIINPVPVITVQDIVNGKSWLVTNVKVDNIFVNIYAGGAEIIYRKSCILNNDINVNFKTMVIARLEGLPFPTNTDGNIQYSPSLFATEKGKYGNLVFISEGGTAYKLMTYDNKAVMSYFLSTAVEGLQDFFTIQGQLYGILDNQIYSFSIVNEIANRGDFIVSVEGLQFVGNTPYEALFFSKTNRCLYSFTGANVLNAKQFVDKISEVRNYKYNPATQSIFLITDIGVIVYSLFGIYQIEFLNCQDMYLLNNGVILTDNEGTFKYVKYYKEETTDDYTKENIQLETMFYGMNNQTVTINDCLYMRIFSEEHEEGDLEVSATTLSLEGRMTEKTTFRIKERDWDKLTHTIYLRYQPKEQRGLGISFSINSPFKIASLSIGSQADAILVDKVSKGAINAPQRTSNNVEW